MPSTTWLLLGEAAALCRRLSATALPPDEAALLDYAALLRGVLANATLDGNSLTEEQVDRLFEGSLELPPSQRYLQVEIDNLVKATRGAAARVKAGDHDLAPWTLQLLHTQVLKGLPTAPSTVAGEYRREASPGIPPKEIPGAMDHLHDWLSSALFEPEHEEERLPFGVVRAVLAHLYLLWIDPFGEGNGRTARLAEHQLLLSAGVPTIAAHQLTVHAARTRAEYGRQLATSRDAGDPTAFIAYQVRGLVDALRALWAEIDQAQFHALWRQHVSGLLEPEIQGQGARRLRLMSDLVEHQVPVPLNRIPQLSPELARFYARLHPKTLQRDLLWLQGQELVLRNADGFLARPDRLRPFSGTATRSVSS